MGFDYCPTKWYNIENMTPETKSELIKIVREYWGDIQRGRWKPKILDDADNEFRRVFEPLPKENQEAWCLAMGALAGFNIMYFSVLDKDGNPIPSEIAIEDPNGEYYYTIHDFKQSKFTEFCEKHGLDLTSPLVEEYEARLGLTSKNHPYVTVAGVRCVFDKMNNSDTLKILKIGMHPNWREGMVDVATINRAGKDEDIINTVLGGKPFRIPTNTNFTERFRKSIFDQKNGVLKDFITTDPNYFSVPLKIMRTPQQIETLKNEATSVIEVK